MSNTITEIKNTLEGINSRITEVLCCIPETYMLLYINYTSIKKKIFLKTVTERENLKVLTKTNEYVLTMWVYGYVVN